MRVNANTALIGRKVALVPYRPEHVPTYHQWMTDPMLLKLTASEPLSIQEEMDMQKRWQEDEDKLTFIILAQCPPNNPAKPHISTTHISGFELSSLQMIGDVNLFFKRTSDNTASGEQEIECEVMVAETEYRGHGFGFEALGILLTYASRDHNDDQHANNTCKTGLGYSPSSFVARIATSNKASLALFKKLGFREVKLVEAFDEVELRPRDDINLAEHWSMPFKARTLTFEGDGVRKRDSVHANSNVIDI